MSEHIDVFISSTSIDLPEYRQAVIDALLGIGLFPSGMEHWPVEDENPVDYCRRKIEEAEIYVGIYAHRYGWRPDGSGGKSITEMEYDWATELGTPRYCFIMHEDHPWPLSRMELEAKEDLDAFKARVKEQMVGFFTTPEDLKALVLQALAHVAQKEDTSILAPYLRNLHHDAMQSGLLSTLDPRTKDPAFTGRQVTVDQVYTRLDTTTPVHRDEEGRIVWQRMSHDLEKMQSDEQTTLLSVMEAANHFDHLVILGDPGSGKSTFVGFLSLCLTGHYLEVENGWLDRLIEQGWKQGALLPVHVILRDFAQDMGKSELHGTAQSLLDHISRLMEKCGCAQGIGAINQTMNDGNALLILDGLDEVPAKSREAVRDAVNMFRQAFDRCRILVTCRILSYANPAWQIPHTETVTLAPFDREKIQHFIRAWYTASVTRGTIDKDKSQSRIVNLSKAVNAPSLRDMATNPMLLTVMAIVHDHQGTLPRETARLYDACVDILMLKWKPEEAHHLREVLELPDETDLYRILWQIAYEAHEKAGDRRGAADIPKKEVMSIAAEEHLEGDWKKAQQFCDYVEERAGLLIGRGGGDSKRRIFAFPHRTFQEYLAGCYIADKADFVEVIDEKARSGANWREVVLLAIGHMYFNKTERDRSLLAVQSILKGHPECYEDWQAVVLAAEILLLIGLQVIEKLKLWKDLLPQAQNQLAALVSEGHLEPVERAAAGRTLSALGDPRAGVGLNNGLPDIEWLPVVGTLQFQLITDEGNQGTYDIPDFYIAKHPITYVQFQAFIGDPEGFHNPVWWDGLGTDEDHISTPGEQAFKYDNHPRERVSWYDAVAFSRWLSDKMDQEIRLPTEWEWQWAATGGDGRDYPWGNEYTPGYANINETIGEAGLNYLQATTAVGMYPKGVAPCGALDMSGNVWEWCLNEYESPANTKLSNNARVLRGGSWLNLNIWARTVSRLFRYPHNRDITQGFRVVCVSHYLPG